MTNPSCIYSETTAVDIDGHFSLTADHLVKGTFLWGIETDGDRLRSPCPPGHLLHITNLMPVHINTDLGHKRPLEARTRALECQPRSVRPCPAPYLREVARSPQMRQAHPGRARQRP